MSQYPFNDDHNMIRDAVRGWLSVWSDNDLTLHKIAEAADGYENGFDRQAWRGFAQEQGLAGVSISENYGGAGLGLLGRAVIMEETGYTLFSAPFFSTCVLATDIIEAFADADSKTDLLGHIAAGEIILAVADGRACLKHDKGRITGTVKPVMNGGIADKILLVVPSNESDGGIELLLTTPDVAGICLTQLPSIDLTRQMSALTCDIAEQDTQRIGHGKAVQFDAVWSIALGALAAECVGGAQRCLDLTLDYTAQRVQFDRPVASFQAVKHRCADMFVAIESARSAAYYAAAAPAEEQREAALIARPYAADRFFSVAGDAIQMHGGIGFTWDYPLHYFFKRARANRALFTSAEASYDKLAALIFEESGT